MVMNFLKRFYVYILFVFLYAPIVVLMVLSFNNSRLRGSWDGFTLRWYIELFRSANLDFVILHHAVAVLSSAIATIIGTAAAIGIHNLHGFKKNLIMNVTYIPVLNPDIVTGVALMILFIFLRLRLGFLTMLLAHITFNIPYVILSVLPKLKQLNNNLYEAALDLGATPWYALQKVIIPQIMPGILTGFLFAFTLSIDDFVISFFTTGSGVSNLSITVFSMARRGVNPKINALSTLMFLTVLILLIIVNLRMSKDKNGKGGGNGKNKEISLGARDSSGGGGGLLRI